MKHPVEKFPYLDKAIENTNCQSWDSSQKRFGTRKIHTIDFAPIFKIALFRPLIYIFRFFYHKFNNNTVVGFVK